MSNSNEWHTGSDELIDDLRVMNGEEPRTQGAFYTDDQLALGRHAYLAGEAQGRINRHKANLRAAAVVFTALAVAAICNFIPWWVAALFQMGCWFQEADRGH